MLRQRKPLSWRSKPIIIIKVMFYLRGIHFNFSNVKRITLFIVNEKAGTLNAKQAVVPIIYKPLKLMAKLKMLESKQVN